MILLTLSPASLSAASRTFVSSAGLDTNTCTRAAPCRSFGAAISFTDVDGELIVLDSAGYGPVTIGQSVTLFAPDGIYAGITATSGDAVSVRVTATDRVILRGLTINSLGANNGIHFVAGGKLRIDSVRVNILLPLVDIDPVRIREVLVNLLSNAVRHARSAVRVTAVDVDRGIQVVITDDGPGMAAEEVPKIFDRFYKGATSPGSGLCLTIARNLVEAHGGRIDVENTPDQGTAIRFDLPSLLHN